MNVVGHRDGERKQAGNERRQLDDRSAPGTHELAARESSNSEGQRRNQHHSAKEEIDVFLPYHAAKGVAQLHHEEQEVVGYGENHGGHGERHSAPAPTRTMHQAGSYQQQEPGAGGDGGRQALRALGR